MAASADLLSLNRRRWEAQLRAQSAATAATAATTHSAGHAGTAATTVAGMRLPAATEPVPTGGLIFWRGQPTRPGNGNREDPLLPADGGQPGMYMPHQSRHGKKEKEWRGHPSFVSLAKGREGQRVPYRNKEELAKNWARTVQVYDENGQLRNDITNEQRQDALLVRYGESDGLWAEPVSSYHKYRIPNTSVVWKEGDCGCCGIKLTAAQWIWAMNLLCFLAHTAHVFLVLYYAYWRHGLDATDHDAAARMLVRVYRITAIPTAEMIANNESQGFDPAKRWTNEFYLRDNDMPINFATLTLSFFAISAFAHLWALWAGARERWWFWYWRQMDDGFCYWRWFEYSLSASIMAMAIALAIGLREQNILAGIFMLHWSTMMFGFLVEYVSVPKYRQDHTAYTTPIGPTQLKQFADSVRNNTPWAKVINYRDANEGHNALKLIDQHEWEGDRPAADIRLAYSRTKDAQDDGAKEGLEAPPGQEAAPQRRGVHIRFIWSQKTRNYIRRMVPHILGWFPISAAWVMIINALETARHDLADVSEEEIPSWVLGAIYGTFVIFWSFTVVQILFQWYSPGYYWGSELIYCALSLTAKLYLGWFLMINVVMDDGSAENALGGVPID